MRIDKMTSRLQNALAEAQSIAVGNDNNFIEPLHLMQALLDEKGGAPRGLLRQLSVDPSRFRQSVAGEIQNLPQVKDNNGDVHMSNGLGRLLNHADKLAQQKGDEYISSELFILAAAEDKGPLGKVFKQFNVNRDSLGQAIDSMRGGETVDDPSAEENREALDKYTLDLTARAEEGKLDPVIGRDDEIRRTIQVLQRRQKTIPY